MDYTEYMKSPDVITKEEGLEQIATAQWTKDEYGWFFLKVRDKKGQPVIAMLHLRPDYCDRGHFQLQIDGHLDLDAADAFPRFFFSTEEADHHVRTFLKWRLWKERVYPHTLEPLIYKETKPYD